jgi:hypothetical protein
VIRADLVDPERHVLVRLVLVRPLVSRRGRETADRDEKAHRKSGLFTLWFFFMHWFDSKSLDGARGCGDLSQTPR